MTEKELLLRAIRHLEVPRVPLMYRALPEVSERLLRHFGLGILERDWQSLAERLGAEAIEALDAGEYESARDLIQQARRCESEYGASPAWDPPAEVLAELWQT